MDRLGLQLNADIAGKIDRALLNCVNVDLDLLPDVPVNGTVEPNAIINARNLYRSCMDETRIETDGVEPLLSIINRELGGWPILQGAAWNGSTFSLADLLVQLRQYDNGIIYSVATQTNQENSSVNDIEVSSEQIESQYDRMRTAVSVRSRFSRSARTRVLRQRDRYHVGLSPIYARFSLSIEQ